MRISMVVAMACLLVAGCVKQTQAPGTLTSKPSDLAVPWTFTIQNERHEIIGSLKVRFTEERAQSCMGGDWKRLTVLDFKSSGEPAFPGRDPLSYTLDGRTLTIGRNEICDAYVMLKGDLTTHGLRGEYFSLGLGGTHRRGSVQGRPER